MLKEQVGQAVQILHLDVGACQHIRLLVTLNESNRDIGLFDSEFVSLLSDYADNVAELSLNSKLPDCSYHELSLMRRYRGANAKTAQIAKR